MKISARSIRSVIAYRKRKSLCEQCGRFENNVDHECKVNYIKADMREEELPEFITDDDYLKNIEIALEELNEQTRIATIRSYRTKKNLCYRCGKEPDDLCKAKQCEENHERADMRSEDDVQADPRTIITPQKRDPSIIDEIKTEQLNKDFIEKSEDPFFRLKRTELINSFTDYIIIDLHRSDTNQKIDFSFIDFLYHKHKCQIVLLGEIEKEFSATHLFKMKKMPGVKQVENLLDQNIVNYILGCKRFFGFPSKYATYCLLNNVPLTTFFDNSKMKLDIACNIVNIPSHVNVDIEVIKRNVLSWRL